MEAAALYRIAMPRGSMSAEEKAALYRIAMPQGPPPTRHASISAFESSTTSTSPLAVTSPTSSRVSSRPSESGPSSLRPSAKHTLDANDDGRGNSKRRDHNAIEKKYRDNINERFRELRQCVPSLRGRNAKGKGKGKEQEKDEEDDERDDGGDGGRDVDGNGEDGDDLEGLEPAHKFNKATIIIKAIEYIRHLEAKQRRSQVQERAMRERIEAFERLFSARSI